MSQEKGAGVDVGSWVGIDPNIDVTELINTTEVAKILGIKNHAGTTARWIRHELFPAVAVSFPEGDGRIVRFWRRPEVVEFAAVRLDLMKTSRRVKGRQLSEKMRAEPNVQERMAYVRSKRKKIRVTRVRVSTLPGAEGSVQ